MSYMTQSRIILEKIQQDILSGKQIEPAAVLEDLEGIDNRLNFS